MNYLNLWLSHHHHLNKRPNEEYPRRYEGAEASTHGQMVKKSPLATSPVVQWLRLHTSNAGVQVQSLVRELDPTCCN